MKWFQCEWFQFAKSKRDGVIKERLVFVTITLNKDLPNCVSFYAADGKASSLLYFLFTLLEWMKQCTTAIISSAVSVLSFLSVSS